MDDKMFPLIVVVALVAIVGLVAILIGGTNKSTLVIPGASDSNTAGQATGPDCDWVHSHPDQFEGTRTWEQCAIDKKRYETGYSDLINS